MVIPHRLWKKGGNENIDSRKQHSSEHCQFSLLMLSAVGHFTIMSYNVLAPHYVSLEKYSLTDTLYLNWEYRRERILDEICFYSPDFVCLQEVSPYDFKEYFLPTLQRLGYDGHFQLKKRDHAADGCATFYQESRFQLLAVQAFAYHDQIQGLDTTADLKARLQPFSNIALVCVFQNRQSPRSLRVRVVNTHFHWDPNYGDTKLLQAAILMEWLERTHRDVPTVIAADLNSKVGDPVLDYMVRGRVAPGLLFAGKDFGRFSGGGPWPLLPSSAAVAAVAAATVNGVQMQQQLLLQQQQQNQNQNQHFPALGQSPATTAKAQQVPQSPVALAAISTGSPGVPGLSGSAYHGYTGQPGQSPPFLLRHGTKLASAYDRRDLPFTNKTPDFCGSIDHILYTSGTLSIRDVLGDLIPVPSSGDAENGGDEQANKLGAGIQEALSAVTTPSPLLPAAESSQVGTAGETEAIPKLVKIVPTIERSGDPDVDAAAKATDAAAQEVDPDLAGTTPTNMGPAFAPAPPPPSTYLTRVQSLPARYYPSDHLPLIAVLKWKTVPILSSSNPTGLSVAGAGSRSRNTGAGVNKGMVGAFGMSGGTTTTAAVPIPSSVPGTTGQSQNEVTYARVTTQGMHSGSGQHGGTGTTPPSALSHSLAAALAAPEGPSLGGSLGKR
ncbi:Endonuclease/exonuclease/phosphatase [Cladochytrium replicatum]|nr:Endonuclease/exonuclease/phosphatase [Cladochytrium replicatum]